MTEIFIPSVPHSDRLAKLDPRSKSVVALLLIGSVLFVDITNTAQVILYLGLAVLQIGASGIPLVFFLRRLLKVYPMILLITLLLPFTQPSPQTAVWLSAWGIDLYREGLMRFISVSFKSIFILLTTTILIATSGYFQLLKGLDQLKAPKIIIAILSYLYRLIFLLADEMNRLQLAFRSRYIHLPFFQKLGILGRMLSVYFVRAVERSDRAYLAMISRGFSGQVYTLNNLQWHAADSFFVISVTIFCAGSLLWL